MSAPETRPAVIRAIRALAHRLRPITSIQDPERFAADFLQALIDEGWRPPLPTPPPRRQPGTGHPPSDEFRQARAKFHQPTTPEDQHHA